MNLHELLEHLRKQKIATWFDLGLFIDRFREDGQQIASSPKQDLDTYKDELRRGGVGF